MSLRNRKVTILGLGRHGGGVAAARHCSRQGAVVTVTDLADEARLAESIAALADVPIARLTLGQHRDEDFSDAEIVVVNPAIKPGNLFIEQARNHGATITSEIELFLEAAKAIGALVLGVTGTVGKSTTCAMLAAMLSASGQRVWLGGNIGHSLLLDLPTMQRGDVVVLELSSFQLHWLSDDCPWPAAAIFTNCCPNHLDWHPSWRHYAASKQRLALRLPLGGWAVFDEGDPEVATWHASISGPHWIAAGAGDALADLRVPGQHNRTNAALAATMAKQLGVSDVAIAEALAGFRGLPHRLAFVTEINGRIFYNDSKSTTPAATLAALSAMERPTWLLLGGADKQIDLSELAEYTARKAKGVAAFGAVAEALERLLTQAGARCHRAATLDEALAWCWRVSAPGEAILLSPGCASTDQFRDFADRGEAFVRRVRKIDYGVQ